MFYFIFYFLEFPGGKMTDANMMILFSLVKFDLDPGLRHSEIVMSSSRKVGLKEEEA